jgi:N-methylhydantoinase B
MSTSLIRYRSGPYGLFGGGRGMPSVTVVNPGTPDEHHYHAAGGIPLKRGDLVSHRPGGGGGFGPASERSPEAIAADLREGYISAEAARRDYGYEVQS